jgi:hypothetical protein
VYNIYGSTQTTTLTTSGPAATLSGLSVPAVYAFQITATGTRCTWTDYGQFYTSSTGGGTCPESTLQLTVTGTPIYDRWTIPLYDEQLSWSASPASITGQTYTYTLDYGTSASNEATSESTTGTGWTVANLPLGTQYFFTLFASAVCLYSNSVTGQWLSATGSNTVEVNGPWSGIYPLQAPNNICWPNYLKQGPPDTITATLSETDIYSEFDGAGTFLEAPSFSTSASDSGFDWTTLCNLTDSTGSPLSLPIQCGSGAGPAQEETWSVSFTITAPSLPYVGSVYTATVIVSLGLEVCANGNIYYGYGYNVNGGLDWVQTIEGAINIFDPTP